MQRHVLMCVLQGIATIFVLSIVVFVLARLTGDPRDILLPVDATPEDRQVLGEVLGLDQPLPVQYVTFISQAAKGEFGKSIRTKRPVNQLISERLPSSLKLAAFAMLVGVLIAIPLGVLAATRRNTPFDSAAKVIAVLGQATPSFWLAIVLVLVFSVELRWFPPADDGDISHYVLPGFTLGWIVAAGMMRLLRSSMLEVLDAEYVKLARVKGISERLVIWKHALRNALMPVVTFAGFYFALLVGMAVVVETVFAWPGVGRLAYEAVMWRDFPVIQAVVLVVSIIVICVNISIDVLYAYLDPRIRY